MLLHNRPLLFKDTIPVQNTRERNIQSVLEYAVACSVVPENYKVTYTCADSAMQSKKALYKDIGAVISWVRT